MREVNDGQRGDGKNYIKNYELAAMPPYSNYPQSLVNAMHVKSLVGPHGAIPENDIGVSAFELDPGTYYGAHAHPQPEIYIITSGTAEFEWGDETFKAEAGTVAYVPPNMSHAIRVTSKEPLKAFGLRWTPDGRHEMWDVPSVMLSEQG